MGKNEMISEWTTVAGGSRCCLLDVQYYKKEQNDSNPPERHLSKK